MQDFITTILSINVHDTNSHPIFGERNTIIRIEDNAGGPFIVIEQENDDTGKQSISIDFKEFPHIVNAVKMLMEQPSIKQLS